MVVACISGPQGSFGSQCNEKISLKVFTTCDDYLKLSISLNVLFSCLYFIKQRSLFLVDC